MKLAVEAGNEQALRFYERRGFATVSVTVMAPVVDDEIEARSD